MIKLSLICFIISVLGILGIYYLSSKTQIENVEIEKIDRTYLGKTITTSGKVISATYNKGNIFLTIKDNSQINVVIFSNVAKFLDKYPKKGDNLIITGVVSEYKGKLQIIPRKPEDVVIK